MRTPRLIERQKMMAEMWRYEGLRILDLSSNEVFYFMLL